MITWTESAKATLENHLTRMRAGLVASGADPAEVAEDLRRHIDEELTSGRIEVVTAADVERMLRKIGVAEGSSGQGSAGAVPSLAPVSQQATSRPTVEAKWHRRLLFFGVVLPAVALVLELLTHMCAAAFFDPIPSLWHVLLVASVPVVNFLGWRAVRLQQPFSNWMAVANTFSLAVGAYYSALYATLVPFALIAIIFLGWGLLPLSPIFALMTSWRLRVLLNRLPGREGREHPGGVLLGLGLAALALGLVVLPPVLTRHWSGAAVSDDPATSTTALKRLRSFGHEQTLLADCYGATRWAGDNPFHFHVQGTPVSADLARNLFYRVTGHAFNEFPPPQLSYATRGWDVFNEFSWDADQGGTRVGGRMRGLSLAQSRLDGLIEGDAGWSYTEWTLEFKNLAEVAREARAQIALPPGGVVSRLTLWVNGEEREAAFAGNGQVRAAYENVVKVQRRDPVLVTSSGTDRVLMQCFPVPPDGGTIKVRLGITSPLELENESTGVVRWPHFIERNFGITPGFSHSVWVESAQHVGTSHPELSQDHCKPGIFALRGSLKDPDLTRASSITRVPRSNSIRSAWVTDPHSADTHYIRQTLTEKSPERPARVVMVVDASRSMDAELRLVAESLARLPEGIEFALLLGRDDTEAFSGEVRKTETGFLKELAGRLAGVRGEGGQDNLPALLRAWDLAAQRSNSVVLWVHGPQPVELENTEALRQRLEWRRPDPGGATPSFYDFQTLAGANRLADTVGRLAGVKSLPRFGSVSEDLARLFATWRGEGRVLVWNRERVALKDSPESARGRKGSKHLARLWAKDEVLRLIDGDNRDEAVRTSGLYQLVTPVCGAVVLETKQQFEQAGLLPVASDSVPSVPEPGALVLLVAGLGLLVAWRLGRRKLPGSWQTVARREGGRRSSWI